MNQNKEVPNNIISLRLARKIIAVLLFVLFFDFVLFPAPAMAKEYNNAQKKIEKIKLNKQLNNFDGIKLNNKIKPIFKNNFPESKDLKIARTANYLMTAYNSEVAQCDDSPCITANGFNVCEHGKEDTIAANFLAFGTKVRIPEIFGDKIFIVRDRMSKKYNNRIDIWMLKKNDAKQFGVKYARIEILEP